MWASWHRQESIWVIALLHDRELESPDDKFSVHSYYLLRTYLMEAVSTIKTWKCLKLQWHCAWRHHLCFCHYIYKPGVVNVRTMQTSGPLLGAQVINMVATKHK